jgi:ATP-dependent Clp protease adaptor protein ClpS
MAPKRISDMARPALPGEETKVADETRSLTRLIPRYHVVLLDDNDHTYEYVIEMLVKLFRHGAEAAFRMACEVDRDGRSIVYTTNREQAEFKRGQIHGYGADWRLPRSKGSMSADIEPAD